MRLRRCAQIENRTRLDIAKHGACFSALKAVKEAFPGYGQP